MARSRLTALVGRGHADVRVVVAVPQSVSEQPSIVSQPDLVDVTVDVVGPTIVWDKVVVVEHRDAVSA